MANFTFQGTIVDTNGEPLSSHTVTIYRKTTVRDFDVRQPTATTDPEGAYSISFTWNDVETGDFEVSVRDGGSVEVGRSVTLWDLGDGTHQVDVVTGTASYRGRSEFRRVDVAAQPLAFDGATAIPYEDLALTDVDYIAGKAKHPPSLIATFIHAHRLSKLTTGIPADAFYGMLREGLSVELSELLAQGPTVQRAALDRAVARNLIDDPGSSALDGYITELDSLAIDSAVYHDVASGESSKFRKMIDSAQRPTEGAESVQRAFLAKYVAHTGDLDSFWTAVIADPGLGQAVHDTYKWCLQIQAACNGHQPLIDVLHAKRNDGMDPVDEFADLATIDVDGWKTLINAGVGVPDTIPTSWSEPDRVQRYAETIARLVSDTVPTRLVHERIKRDSAELSGADDLDTFFTDNPNFDLRDDVFQRYLAANPTALDNIPTTGGRRDACEANVKIIQRLGYLAPRGSTYDTIKPLYKAEIRSAADVDAMGPVAFVRKFADDFGVAPLGRIRARAVYDRASHVYGMTLALLGKYAPAFNTVPLGGVMAPNTVPSSAPDLESLFGSMDYCGCEHCRSVFSPAAYMVDLLQFLRQQPGTGSNDALTELQARRPDLTKIDLTCANASTALPYIDLVNELLETRVSNGPAPGDDYWQTTWSAAELALRPENRDDGAYTELIAAPYPWGLPFDRARTEADLYLGELNVERDRILETFDTAANTDAFARAQLGISAAMGSALTAGVGFSTLDCWNGNNAAALTSVAKVLDVSNQTFEEMQVVLGTEFVGAGLSLSFAPFPDDCDLDQASVTGLTDPHLERWHRFVRLQRALHWSAYELDAALRALAPTPNSLDAAFLQRLGAAKRIAERLDLRPLDAFGLWSFIDLSTPPEDADAPSLYASLFLDRTLVDDPASSNFALTGADLTSTVDSLDHDSRATVAMAALSVSSTELAQIVQWLVDSGATPDTTDVGIISAARRRVLLARALGVSIVELRRLIELTGLSPFHETGSVPDMAALQRTVDFLDAAQRVLDSAFTAEALDYIVANVEPTTAGVALDSVAAGTLLGALDRQLAGITERYAFASDPTGVRLRDALAEYLPASVPANIEADTERLDELMAIVAGTSTQTDNDQNTTISNEMGTFLTNVATTQANLVGNPPLLTDRTARYDHVLEELLAWLDTRARRAATVQTLAEGLGLAIDVGEKLLVDVDFMQGAGATPLVETFEAGGNLDGNGDPTAASSDVLVRLYKAGALVIGHGLDATALDYLYGPGAPSPTPWIDIDDLTASGASTVTFAQWLRLADVARGRALFPEHADTLEVLRDAGTVADVENAIADRGGWRVADVKEVRTQLGYLAVTDFDDEAAALVIVDAMAIVDATGLSATTLFTMGGAEASAAEADALRQSLRSRHSDASWASTGKDLQDPLREQQRKALVAYLLANGDGSATFETENDLYAHYLLDVEMSACATTSRIKLALSSIQLFVQRVFLNLEAGISFDDDAAVQYRWMKNYRVWEANRKVFLYPENWIEPELRSDKSPLYEELEATLSQDEPSEQLTERAYMTYLAGLDEIAKPEVMGLVRERVSGSGDSLVERLHVVARTRGEPRRWLYRTQEDKRFWTPWVTLSAAIDGDHVLPVVFNGRLYVLWPSFKIASEEITEVDQESEGKSVGGHVEISLNWIERRFGEWSPARMSAPFKLPNTIQSWELPEFRKEIRLATRTIQSEATGRLALEVAVRRYVPYAVAIGEESTGKLMAHGRFVLEVTDDEFVSQALVDEGVVESWLYKENEHVLAGQALDAATEEPTQLQLETKEARWPRRLQAQIIFADPPKGYRLMFAQTDLPGLVEMTGFFYQDRWRSLFIEPRDIHRAKLGTLKDVDPADIEAAPFIEQAGLLDAPPVVDTKPKRLSLAPKVLAIDGLKVQSKTYAGLQGVFGANLVANNKWAPDQVAVLEQEEQAKALSIHLTVATQKAPRATLPWMGKRYRAQVFEHPYTSVFMGEVRANGVEGLLDPPEGQSVDGLARQQLSETIFSATDYDPQVLETPWPEADVDFSVGGAYSSYNWELFFHAPLLLAKRLTDRQRFAEADAWLRKIFDPTASDGSAPARYWKIKPFFESATPPSIHNLLLLLHYDGTDEQITQARDAFEDQIWRWRRSPFDPHLIASLRDGTYQRAVVMRTIDNLIAWGDSLFARDSIESINEATQLYILAQNILGPRPVMVDPHGDPTPQNFEELEAGGLDAFSNAIVELENYTLGSYAHADFMEQDANSGMGTSINSARVPHSWYFCVPPNDKLLGYWDVVEDRLRKIRNCQNLAGIERKLALFQPPIDPGALVSAAASGDYGSALAAISGRAPMYRFRVVVGKALELANEVRTLGGTLLQVLEKRDAAKLAELRASLELGLQTRVRSALELRIAHAEQQIDSLEAAKLTVQNRRAHFAGLLFPVSPIVGTERTNRSKSEQEHLASLGMAKTEMLSAVGWIKAMRVLSAFPNIQLGIQGFGSSPVLTTTFGTSQFTGLFQAHASIHQNRSSQHSLDASKSASSAAFDRRVEDWTLQEKMAADEVEHLRAQLVGANTQVEVAKAEFAAHDRRIEDAKAVDAFMQSRYTNADLYAWMEGQIKQVYKQAYNLAHRMALSAEQAYRFELQRDDTFIGYAYWDQTHAGLLAGDLLVQDLRRMDAAYLDNNEREYELTKFVSLAKVDPYALAILRETGSCYFSVPEWVYDLDHPGQIRRRIKSVSVAMPAVAGPHVGGGCTLTLQSSKMRTATGGSYAEVADDSRFAYRYGQVERIATSSGRDSTGLFEPSLQDPRYLPFEGAGAISTWHVALPSDFRQFDYESIGDVLLTIRYTAREGGSQQAQDALNSLATISAAQDYANHQSGGTGAAMLLRASVDFADAWYTFLRQENGADPRTFTFELDADRFPHVFAQRPNLEITGLRFILATSAPAAMTATVSPAGTSAASFTTNSELGGHMLATWDDTNGAAPGTFTLSVNEADIPAGLAVTYDTTNKRFDDEKVRELVIVVFFRDQA